MFFKIVISWLRLCVCVRDWEGNMLEASCCCFFVVILVDVVAGGGRSCKWWYETLFRRTVNSSAGIELTFLVLSSWHSPLFSWCLTCCVSLSTLLSVFMFKLSMESLIRLHTPFSWLFNYLHPSVHVFESNITCLTLTTGTCNHTQRHTQRANL